MRILLLILSISILISCSYGNKYFKKESVCYSLNITDAVISDKEKNIHHYLLNGSISGPVLKAKKGELLKVVVNNNTDKNFYIHWHGLKLSAGQKGDSTPSVFTIKAQARAVYQFPVQQTGTYWYRVQEIAGSEGIYGGIIFGKEEKNIQDDSIFIFSGLRSASADNTFEMLHPALITEDDINLHLPDLFFQQQGWVENHMQVKKRVFYEDEAYFSNINYTKHLINGQAKPVAISDRGDNKVKLRLVNAYENGYLNLVYSGGDIEVTAVDGLSIKPVKVKNLKIAMGETYDIILPTEEGVAFELVAFLLGNSAYSNIIIGSGDLVPLKNYNRLNYPIKNYYSMYETLPHQMTDWEVRKANRTFLWTLTGSSFLHNWMIKDKERPIIRESAKVGDTVRLTVFNRTEKAHTLYLEGAFFKVIGRSKHLFKHTVLIDPKDTISLEFTFDRRGGWLLQCQNLLHALNGMKVMWHITD